MEGGGVVYDGKDFREDPWGGEGDAGEADLSEPGGEGGDRGGHDASHTWCVFTVIRGSYL